MTQTETLLPRPAYRPERDPSRPLVSLIEVPEVKGSQRLRVHTGAYDYIDRPRSSRRTGPTRRRRRLRREIRIAGCALLLLAPLVSACTLGWSTRPVRVLACSITEATAQATARDARSGGPDAGGGAETTPDDPPGDVVLSNEPASKSTDTDVPVIFPGYVLPDDNIEGPAHEGS